MHKIDAPRAVPLSVQLYLRLCDKPEAIVGAILAMGGFGAAMFFAIMLHAALQEGKEPDRLWVGTGCFAAMGVCGLCYVIYTWFIRNKAIWLLQNGTMTQGKFLAVGPVPAEEKSKGLGMVMAEFTYQVDDKMYTASTRTFGASRLTFDTCKDIFYDPTQPEQSVVLDGLPDGVHFDEPTGRFWVNVSSYRYTASLLMAAIICLTIVILAVLVMTAI